MSTPSSQSSDPSAVNGDWFAQLQRSAAERHRRIGVPPKWREDWRNTDTRRILAATLESPAPGAKVGLEQLGTLIESPVARLVFVDGHWRGELSRTAGLPRGLTVRSLAEVLPAPERLQGALGLSALLEDAPFVALNTSRVTDGALIEVQRGALVGTVEVVFLTTERAEARATHPRVVVSTGPGSYLTVVERHVGLGEQPYLTNAVTELAPGTDATIRHVRIQDEGARAVHLATVVSRVPTQAKVLSTVITLGAETSRTAVWARLAGEQASCSMDGLYAPVGSQRHDHYTLIDHAVPKCSSSELYKGVIAGDAVGSFLGRILIGKGAVGSDTAQMCRSLLLSERARANMRPQLEIDNDDVCATHGATVGQLDADALFYLQSRGITPAVARGLLIEAFVREVLERTELNGLATRLADRVVTRGVEVSP